MAVDLIQRLALRWYPLQLKVTDSCESCLIQNTSLQLFRQHLRRDVTAMRQCLGLLNSPLPPAPSVCRMEPALSLQNAVTLLIAVNRILESDNSASLIRACTACELDSNWHVWLAAGVGASRDWATCYSLARFNHPCRPNIRTVQTLSPVQGLYYPCPESQPQRRIRFVLVVVIFVY